MVAELHQHRRPEVLPGHPRHRRAETSLRQVIDRIVDTITAWGINDGYFVDEHEGAAFRNELKYILLTQRAAFNSPVWFNIGVKGVPAQGSACFILAVEDTMDGILNWYREEGTIFKGGSGSGINLSAIRSSREHLKGGGTASGPVSFIRGADASAGTIKCLHHETPIVTDRGVVAIREVRASDAVLSHATGMRPSKQCTTTACDLWSVSAPRSATRSSARRSIGFTFAQRQRRDLARGRRPRARRSRRHRSLVGTGRAAPTAHAGTSGTPQRGRSRSSACARRGFHALARMGLRRRIGHDGNECEVRCNADR